ncbi:hypothetical protein Mhar_0706 [Methanothrix harundinacea 6Ac]|uniref:Gingipain domain-containing protein n=2 Tax=Methanothrix harundinacea TaxID=301375 RepID=G7WK91_METH6|nr:hypothetical protein Mhar_0706 [Methanothrix harundinacea 6Ac]
MQYTISGRIRELESHLGISGLIVRSYDRGRRYDKSLKTTITDSDGSFKMVYQKDAAPDLFEARPEIFLRIFTPPFRFLMDTKEKMQWGAKDEEHIELEIPREKLGQLSPSGPDGIVEAGVNLLQSDLKMEKVDMLDIPRLPGWDNGGLIGAPSLPEKIQYIVLPLGAKVLKVEVQPGRSIRLPAEVNPLPVRAPKQDWGDRIDPEPIFPGSVSLMQVYPSYLKQTKPYPADMVVRLSIRQKESVQILRMLVRPVQFDPVKRNFIFHPNLRYTVHYDLQEARPAEKALAADRTFRQRRLQRIQSVLDRDHVFMAKDVGSGVKEVVDLPSIPYVIITDNSTWPEKGTDGNGAPEKNDPRKKALNVNGPGPVEHFERLAEWKTSRGMRTRVVTVESILAGDYGDFAHANSANPARDLQEVIRNFIKWAHNNWGLEYLLLGGSLEIVPMRKLLGYATCKGKYPGWDFCDYGEDIEASRTNPPPRGRVLVGNPKKARLCHECRFFTVNSLTKLCSSRGKVIKFKENRREIGNGELGWYFTKRDYRPLYEDNNQDLKGEPEPYNSEKGYSETPKDTPVCNLIVEGPESDINDDFYWILEKDRLIPSDLYYACMDSEPSDKHDFDLFDNGYYGQYRWVDDETGEHGEETPVDSSDPSIPDIWVGRAPVRTGEDARSFVDRVLTYERLQTPVGDNEVPEVVDPTYLKRVIMAVDLEEDTTNNLWQDPDRIRETPDSGKFIYSVQDDFVLIHLQEKLFQVLRDLWKESNFHVVARFFEADREFGTDISCIYDDGSSVPITGFLSWRFVERRVGMGRKYYWGSSSTPTEYVKLTGSALKVAPKRIIWFYGYPRGDTWTRQAEGMRNCLSGLFGEFDDYQRYYSDYKEVWGTASLPPAQPLKVENIRAALDRGCHLAILQSHGNPSRCAMVWCDEGHGARDDFKNHNEYFIAVAYSSCHTAEPDAYINDVHTPENRNQSLGEKLVLHPGGGAVAYIGNTRMGFGNDARHKAFWRSLYRNGRLGPAAGDQSWPDRDLWSVYERILYGDPEMRVWTKVPKKYQVVRPDYLELPYDGPFEVCVLNKDSPMALQRVTLMGGWTNSSQEPVVLESRLTDGQGMASFKPSIPQDLTEITLTVVSSEFGTGKGNFVPYVAKVPVIKLQQSWRRCTKCHGLFSNTNPRYNHCPVDDGPHEEASGERYVLVYDSPDAPGQQGWRRCTKCRSLFFAGDKEKAGKCRDGNEHIGEHLKYAIGMDPSITDDPIPWRWCDKCQVLHRPSGSTTGPCYKKGERHNASGSSYFLRKA